MFRRIMLAISFVAALGVAGFVATDSADAHGRRGWYGPRGYYGANYGAYYPHMYRSSYYPPAYYGPVYYGGGYGHHHCHDRGGVSISFGF